jgi:hypothetical protein
LPTEPEKKNGWMKDEVVRETNECNIIRAIHQRWEFKGRDIYLSVTVKSKQMSQNQPSVENFVAIN